MRTTLERSRHHEKRLFPIYLIAIRDSIEPVYALRHLSTLIAVADHGSFGRAATALGYTQSSVSQQIAALEKTAGGPLFDRPGGPKPVRLTPLGVVVLDHGRELLDRAQAMNDAVERF